MRTFLISLLSLALLFPIPVAPAAGSTHLVAVVDFGFEDAETGTVVTQAAVGDTVKWVWAGAAPHTVTAGVHAALNGATGSPFASAVQETGEFQVTFNAPGRFVYYCALHLSMRGVVVVE